MRAVLQCVSQASVDIEIDSDSKTPERVSEIGRGLLILIAVEKGDTSAEAEWMARKIAELRIFEDADGKMNRAITDLEPPGEVLLVSQFTLAADCRKGRRPSFVKAAPPDEAKPILARVKIVLEAAGLQVSEGRFGAHMHVSLVNDGPVTIVLEKRPTA